MVDTWVQIISSVGFPICACFGLGWYVKYITDKYGEEINDLQREHKEEIAKVTEALNNNTVALTKLCEKFDKE